MTWTIYLLEDPGTVVFNGWPGDEHPRDSFGGWDDAVHGAAEGACADPAAMRWNPGALGWEADRAAARDRRWEEAKAYSESVASGGFALTDIGTIQTDAASREAIRTLVDEARDRIAAGETGWSTAFVNEENEPVPVTAAQILAIYAAARAFLGACYAARQAVRAALDAALGAGATAEQIAAIDITIGYPSESSYAP